MEDIKHGGVLSQTLASSPCIKSILSARIRCPALNDVVMVGYSSIHLREFTPAGQLTSIIAEIEFGVQILAAKVISADVSELSTVDAILENGKDEIRFKLRGQPCEESQPPQVVVLSVATSDLIFVYAKNLPNGDVQFVHARRAILGGQRWPKKYGKHLAVDRESRALAVASSNGSFGILSLKFVDEIKRDVDEWDPRDARSFKPTKEQRFVQVDGAILRMDFLRSSSTDPRRLILLLIVANQGRTRLLLYKWDSWRSLTTMKPLSYSGYQLPDKDAFPHLLIPSCRSASFAIVVGQSMVFYDNVDTDLKRTPILLRTTPESCIEKQWVQWVKPFRHEGHRKRKEDIFLIREDGLVNAVIGAVDLASRNTMSILPGDLKIHVDTAVCALAAPPHLGGDILIACGDTTEGGVFHLAAREHPNRRQTIPNWSPINDFVYIENAVGHVSRDHGSVMAATGLHEGRSALTELRYGAEAGVLWTSTYDEARTIDRVWALERISERKLLLLGSHHEHTTLLVYDVGSGEIEADYSESYPQFCFDLPTLAAATLPRDAIIQITSGSICILGPTRQTLKHLSNRSAGEFTCADVHANTGIWIAARRNFQNIELMVGGVLINVENEIEFSQLPEPLAVEFAPVSMSLNILAGKMISLLASQDGQLHLYDIHNQQGLRHWMSWSLSDFDIHLSQSQISSVSILTLESANNGLLLCGLKTGKALLFSLGVTPGEGKDAVHLKFESEHFLGTTAVTIRIDSKDPTGQERIAHIVCATKVMRVVLYQNRAGLDYSTNPLLLPDQGSIPLAAISTIAVDRVGQFPDQNASRENDPSGALVIIGGNHILMVAVGSPSMVPRYIRSTGTTKHLIYSQPLGKCIVSRQDRLLTGSQATERLQTDRPSLMLVDPNMVPSNDPIPFRSNFYFGEKGEKVRVLMQWAPADRKLHYDMVIIGSDLGKDGRVSYINVSRMLQAKTGLSAKLIATYPKKSISAICAYKMSSLVICAGRELKLLHLDLNTRRWQAQAEFELPSRATEIKTKGSTIFVATSLHSFMLIREVEGQLRLVGSDSWAGKARNIIPYGNGSTLVNLVSEQGSRILNFSDRPAQGTRPAFEAVLPQAIDKIAHLKLPSSSDRRERFLGTTIDGTVYLFSTLTESEMNLLNFLEQLCMPVRKRPAKNAALLAQTLTLKYADRLENAGITPPSLVNTHARGDVLKAMLEPGCYNIRFLLQRRAKLEDEVFKKEDEIEKLKHVATPVIGIVGDVVDGVILWLRKTLNIPDF